jgi:hypothetical protein
VIATVYVLNHTAARRNSSRTPYELWVGNAPAVHHMRTFGCVVHVKTIGYLKKLNDCSRSAIFVSYALGSKAYLTYDPTTQCVSITRYVVFDEEAK